MNARLKIFWGADDGNVTGARQFHAFVGAVMVVHLTLATLLAKTPRWEGTLAKALQEVPAARAGAEQRNRLAGLIESSPPR